MAVMKVWFRLKEDFVRVKVLAYPTTMLCLLRGIIQHFGKFAHYHNPYSLMGRFIIFNYCCIFILRSVVQRRKLLTELHALTILAAVEYITFQKLNVERQNWQQRQCNTRNLCETLLHGISRHTRAMLAECSWHWRRTHQRDSGT